MEYIDNGITFNNVKDLSKDAGLQSNTRYAGSNYDYDENENLTGPKFLMNAIDIDWNDALIEAEWPDYNGNVSDQ